MLYLPQGKACSPASVYASIFREREALPTAGEQQVRGHLEKLDMFRLVGLDGSCWGCWRSWQMWDHYGKTLRLGEVPNEWKKADILPISKKGKKEHLGNYRLVSFTSWPKKVMEYILISKHAQNKKTVRNSQCGFSKGKLYLTHLIAALNEMTCYRGEGEW